MLPSELLLVRRRKGRIWPMFASLSDGNLDLAAKLVKMFQQHRGQKKRVLEASVEETESLGYDYRFVRGLSVLLQRRSDFRCDVEVDPVEVRRRLFQAAGRIGLPTTVEEKSRIVESVSEEMKISAELIEEVMYADLDSELVLTESRPLPADELIRDYNLSLTQTLLFNSTEMSFTASGNWQQIFYSVKKLGLIYEVSRRQGFSVKIDGPASLFRLMRRYGTALAKLLPAIIAAEEWMVQAKILWKYTNEICDFKIESRRHGEVLKKPGAFEAPYDSTVERSFATRFEGLDSGWHLRREPEPIPAGRYVIIPDFSFERDGIKVFMEVVGFWTPEYLERKIEKLKNIEETMLIVVDKGLACRKLETLGKSAKIDTVYYRDKIPLAPIIRYLEEAYQKVKKKHTQLLEQLPVRFTEPIVGFEEFANRIGVSIESVRKILTEKTPQGYMVLPNSLVKKEKMKEIQRKLEEKMSAGKRICLPEAAGIIDMDGVEDASNVLKIIGYKISWKGISPEEAEVTAPTDS